MANEIARLAFISILSFILMRQKTLIQGQQVPCLFLFGDSQFDNGNNNNLSTTAKANYPPYGIDFPDGPTGRFTNGKNIADYLATFLGFNSSIQPYATAKGQDILKGVNYASGGAGILLISGSQLGQRIPLDIQLLNHAITKLKLIPLLPGNTTVDKYLNKCLYIVNMGSNDYINNYYLPENNITRNTCSPECFADKLIERYSIQLTTLYFLGARKVAVFGLGLIGCIPQELRFYPVDASGCVDFINNAVILFNDKLRSLVHHFNNGSFPKANFTYIDIFAASEGDPSALGATVVNAPCCVVSNQTGQCSQGTTPCSNRSTYVFWDNFHPTSFFDAVTATLVYSAPPPLPSYGDPFDIQTLAAI